MNRFAPRIRSVRCVTAICFVVAVFLVIVFDPIESSMLFQTPLPDPRAALAWISSAAGGTCRYGALTVEVPVGFTHQGGANVFCDVMLAPLPVEGRGLIPGTEIGLGIWPPDTQTEYQRPIRIRVKLDRAQVQGREDRLAMKVYNPATAEWSEIESHYEKSTYEIRTALLVAMPVPNDFKDWGGRTFLGVFEREVRVPTQPTNSPRPKETLPKVQPGPSATQPATTVPRPIAIQSPTTTAARRAVCREPSDPEEIAAGVVCAGDLKAGSEVPEKQSAAATSESGEEAVTTSASPGSLSQESLLGNGLSVEAFGGFWEFSDDVLILGAPGTQNEKESRLVLNSDTTLQDYVFSGQFQLDRREHHEMGFLFRIKDIQQEAPAQQDRGHYYQLSLNPGDSRITLYRVANGASGMKSVPYRIDSGRWHRFALEATASSVRFFLDSSLVFESGGLTEYKSGSVGLEVYAPTTASFKDLEVEVRP